MKPIEQDQNYNGEIQLHTNSEKKDFQQQCVANEKMMVKMKKIVDDIMTMVMMTMVPM